MPNEIGGVRVNTASSEPLRVKADQLRAILGAANNRVCEMAAATFGEDLRGNESARGQDKEPESLNKMLTEALDLGRLLMQRLERFENI